MRPVRLTSLSLFLVGVALGACEGCGCDGSTPPPPDVDDVDDIVGRDGGGGDDRDGGGAALDDGGGGALDAGPPPTTEELATELCLAYRRGLLSLERHLALESPPARCSNEELAPDVDDDEPLPVGACGVQDEVRELFLRALGGGRVAIDVGKMRACLARGRQVRAAAASYGELHERAAGILALPDDDACAGAVTPLVTTPGATCLQAWDCAPPLACEADPVDSFSLKCLSPAAEGERCHDLPEDGAVALRRCAALSACVLGICTRRLEADAPCSDDGVPCREGLTCLPSGACGVPGGLDASCVDHEDCAEGYRCDRALQVCAGEIAPLDDGEPCLVPVDRCAKLCSVCRPLEESDGGVACQDRAPEGERCSVDDHCRAGLFCSSAGECAPYRAAGEACGVDEPCEAGLVCTDTDPPLLPGDGGAPVVEEDAGAANGPTCRALRALGQSCERAGVWQCLDGACVGGECVAGALDDPCLADGDCAEGSLCVAERCARAPRAGAPCTSDGRCAAGLLCRDDRCRELPSAGEPCTDDLRCGEGAFCPDGDAGVCEALRAPGQPCLDDTECGSGICLDTLTCSAQPASCLTTVDAFAQLVGLGLLLPLLSSVRRRRVRDG